MVSNRRAGKSRQPTEEDFCPTDSSDEYEEREERAPVTNKARGTKRVRATKPRDKDRVTVKRHKKANLSMLPGMPIDILYEVRESLPFHLLADIKCFPDILSCPPEGTAPHLLDGEDSQWVPHQQVITTYLAGFV